MDIQAYILSGAIESYVLGLASAAEAQEVETLAAQYPEIKRAVTDFEADLEKDALANAVPPPPMLKQKVMDALAKEAANNQYHQAAPTSSNADGVPAKVISLTAAPKGVRWLRGAVAASVILLLGSATLNFYYYSQYKKFNNQYTALLLEKSGLTAQNQILQASYDVLKDTSMKRIQMNAASPEHAGAVATVFWNANSNKVNLIVNNLPQHAADKQYQLWAIVDGKPVDAGMLETNQSSILLMKNITGNVQAFAITLEQKGGSPTPTMEQMFVVGKV